MVLPTAVNLEKTATPGATGFLYAQNVHITRKTDAGWDHVRAIRVLRSRGVSIRSCHWDVVHQGKEVTELGTVPIGPVTIPIGPRRPRKAVTPTFFARRRLS